MDLPGFFRVWDFFKTTLDSLLPRRRGSVYLFRGSKNYGVQVVAAPERRKKLPETIYTRETPMLVAPVAPPPSLRKFKKNLDYHGCTLGKLETHNPSAICCWKWFIIHTIDWYIIGNVSNLQFDALASCTRYDSIYCMCVRSISGLRGVCRKCIFVRRVPLVV